MATALNEMTATVAEVARHASRAAATQDADDQADAGLVVPEGAIEGAGPGTRASPA